VEHTAAYNVDVANCDRRRREFRLRNSIVINKICLFGIAGVKEQYCHS